MPSCELNIWKQELTECQSFLRQQVAIPVDDSNRLEFTDISMNKN